VFNFGASEIVVLICLGLILLGPSKLRDLWRRNLDSRSRNDQDLHQTEPAPWGRFDWILLSMILTLSSLAVALAGVHR
jgi:hypothetical protein